MVGIPWLPSAQNPRGIAEDFQSKVDEGLSEKCDIISPRHEDDSPETFQLRVGAENLEVPHETSDTTMITW